MKIRIITDDFSSATDGLPAFAERGWDTAVVLAPANAMKASVISVDTDSRLLAAAQAAGIVKAWAAAWANADILKWQQHGAPAVNASCSLHQHFQKLAASRQTAMFWWMAYQYTKQPLPRIRSTQ
jgi:hypothetical protein